MPCTQPHEFASTVAHFMICVHATFFGRAGAFAFATHASAWHAADGAQSASAVHASSLKSGSHNEQPQSFAPVATAAASASAFFGTSATAASAVAGSTEASGSVGATTGPGPVAFPGPHAAATRTATENAARNPTERLPMSALYRVRGLDTQRSRVHLGAMSNEDKPDPLEDVRKGLGLLFRAAKTAVKKLPTEPIEKVVIDGAREVGRAVENVASSLEKEVFGDRSAKKQDDEEPVATKSDAPKSEAHAEAAPPADPAPDAAKPKTDEEPPKGPRVA